MDGCLVIWLNDVSFSLIWLEIRPLNLFHLNKFRNNLVLGRIDLCLGCSNPFCFICLALKLAIRHACVLSWIVYFCEFLKFWCRLLLSKFKKCICNICARFVDRFYSKGCRIETQSTSICLNGIILESSLFKISRFYTLALRADWKSSMLFDELRMLWIFTQQMYFGARAWENIPAGL